jgi:hypothetical protein
MIHKACQLFLQWNPNFETTNTKSAAEQDIDAFPPTFKFETPSP